MWPDRKWKLHPEVGSFPVPGLECVTALIHTTASINIFICLELECEVWHLDISSLSPFESEKLLLLPRDKIHTGVLQQRSKDKQQTHRHPDVYGLHVRHLLITHTHTKEYLFKIINFHPYTIKANTVFKSILFP